MIANQLQPMANHLWQSTLFVVVAGLLTLALSNNRAQIRYCLWLAASVKFLVPFSLLMMVGSLFERHTAMATAWGVNLRRMPEASSRFASCILTSRPCRGWPE